MKKKYIVTLTELEHKYLEDLVSKGKNAAYRIKHANILLHADSGKSDREIAQLCRCHLNTVAAVRQRLVEEGIESALERKPREKPPTEPKLDGEQEARLIALACSKPPAGVARWTLQLLAYNLVKMEIVESISTATICRVLKKNELKPHLRRQWVIPPAQNAAFVANMEDILDLYQQPFNPSVPVICMDEQSVQLIEEKRVPIAAGSGPSERYDYEYGRQWHR